MELLEAGSFSRVSTETSFNLSMTTHGPPLYMALRRRVSSPPLPLKLGWISSKTPQVAGLPHAALRDAPVSVLAIPLCSDLWLKAMLTRRHIAFTCNYSSRVYSDNGLECTKDQDMKLLLLLFLLTAGPAVAQTLTDEFSGSGALSDNWTNVQTNCVRSAGKAVPAVAGKSCIAIYTGTTFPADEYVEFTLTTTSCAGGSDSTALTLYDNTQTGYVWFPCHNDIYIVAKSSGVGPVGSYTSCPVVHSGDRLRFQRVGNNLSCIDKTTGEFFTGFDNTHPQALSPGMWIDQTAGGRDAITNFQAGAYSAFSANPSILTTGTSGNTVTLTGTNTLWTAGTSGTPNFTVTNSGGTGCAITARKVTSANSVTLTLDAGGVQGTCLLHDPSTLNTFNLTIHTPQTWYIRLDGGTATQCTGHANAAYPGSGSHQPCALNHPYWLLAVGSALAWRKDYSGGDTVQFADLGPYYYGEKNGSFGYDWNGAGINTGGCARPNIVSYNCTLPPLPTGASSAPTRWLGKNAGACHTLLTGTANPNRFNLNNPTQLVAINGAYYGMSLQGSGWSDVECLQFQSRISCSVGGDTPSIVGTSKTGTVASYQWYDGSFGAPLVNQHLNISGTKNGGGIFNGNNLVIASQSGTTLKITQSQSNGTAATFTYTLASGVAPRNGDITITRGTTNCGGALNGIYALRMENVTPTTFQIAFPSASCPARPESGLATDLSSGIFTVDGFPSGTVALASESGSAVPYGKCGNSTTGNDFGAYGIVFEFQANQGPANFIIKDVATEGFNNSGVIGSHLNQQPSDISTASFMKIMGNGASGWNADGGGCGTNCESVGTLNMDHIMMDFNGMVEVFPNGGYSTTTGQPLNGYNYGYAQQTGGYGDGFVQIASGDYNLTITNSESMFNTQDGYDLLHLGDDSTRTQNLTLNNDWAEGNMGQTYKVGGNANVTMYNDVSIGNCKAVTIGTSPYFAKFPSGWNAGLQNNGDYCRAGGDQYFIMLNDNKTVSVIHNTSMGYGATMYDVGCGTCTGHENFIFKNNINIGYIYPDTGEYAAGFYYESVNPWGAAGSRLDHNLWYNMRAGTCPQDRLETNYQCGDPKLTQQVNVDAIDPRLTVQSTLARGKGMSAGLTKDFFGNTFLSPPAIGSYEFIGSVVNSGGNVARPRPDPLRRLFCILAILVPGVLSPVFVYKSRQRSRGSARRFWSR